MDEAGRRKLLEEYAGTKSPDSREKIILEYAPLVKVVAGRLSMYLGYNVEYEDLVSYGYFRRYLDGGGVHGLDVLHAAENRDAGKIHLRRTLRASGQVGPKWKGDLYEQRKRYRQPRPGDEAGCFRPADRAKGQPFGLCQRDRQRLPADRRFQGLAERDRKSVV